jgi:hypothetical protein
MNLDTHVHTPRYDLKHILKIHIRNVGRLFILGFVKMWTFWNLIHSIV